MSISGDTIHATFKENLNGYIITDPSKFRLSYDNVDYTAYYFLLSLPIY